MILDSFEHLNITGIVVSIIVNAAVVALVGDNAVLRCAGYGVK